jgi:RNA recognition motif-containing protein
LVLFSSSSIRSISLLALGRQPQDTIMESTRVFVSGLPPTFSNDQLRKHFASRFQVTDAHVLPKRRIGFVGLKTHEAAKEAAKYFNKTYVKMSKISVDIAKPVCGSISMMIWLSVSYAR